MWTLAVEQQFYILFGAVMLVIPARRHLVFLLLALVIAFAGALWALYALPFPGKYIVPFNGFVSIICGGIASIWMGGKEAVLPERSNSILSLACCAVLVGLALLRENPTFIPNFDVLALIGVSIFSAVLFVEITRNQSGIVTRVLDVPVLRWLGGLSYGIYIIHGVVRDVTLTHFHMYSSVRTFAVVTAVTLVLAQMSRILIELPALRMKYKSGRPVSVAQTA
jgi:peptidoglycan/LPS O-acetylase OafA/YrhL